MDEQDNYFYNINIPTLNPMIYSCGATSCAPPEPPPTPDELEKRRIESEKWEREQNNIKYKRLEKKSRAKGLELSCEIYGFKDMEELECFQCKKPLGYGIFIAAYADYEAEVQFCSKECFDKACEKDEKRRMDKFEEFKKTMEA